MKCNNQVLESNLIFCWDKQEERLCATSYPTASTDIGLNLNRQWMSMLDKVLSHGSNSMATKLVFLHILKCGLDAVTLATDGIHSC